jgi:flagellar basal-body rod modification protein FlgD
MPDAISSATSTATTTATSSVDRNDQMGKDVFLKLLVAQLKYQDPSNPADSSQMMSQTATFTQVEKLDELAKQNTALLTLQRSTSAAALVGRTVTYTDSNGASQTGTVSSVKLGTDTTEAVATVNGVSVEMGRITDVAKSATA